MSWRKNKSRRSSADSPLNTARNLAAAGTASASQGTLVSLAILKSQRDEGQDYLDLLRPFVLHVLCSDGLKHITDVSISEGIANQFGLEIPHRTTQLVLQRIARSGGLKRADGVYSRTDSLPHVNLESTAATARRHIAALIAGLRKHARELGREYASDEEAMRAVCDFLTSFGLDSLRAILRGTALPDAVGQRPNHYVVATFIRTIGESDPERFESLSVLAQGHMLANALVCPDLVNAPKTFERVVFYLDTPLLVQALGLEGDPRSAAASELLRLVKVLGGKIAVFSHVREELEGVIRGASDFIESPKGRGRIVLEARQSGTTKSDLVLFAASLDASLERLGVEIRPTPDYENSLQIDEQAFAEVLADEVNYYNAKARQYDINSIRSVYVLRRGHAPRSLERAEAVLVTTNAALARSAYEYGRNHEDSCEVSTTITDFSLANLAWLKAPMQAPQLPMKELLSVAYAAVRPSSRLLDRYLAEAERLQARGTISERDLQVLRSDLRAQDSLMELTLGDDDALSEETVTETLRRVKAEILDEANERLSEEESRHEATRTRLVSANNALQQISQAAHERSVLVGRAAAWFASAVVAALIVAGLAFGLGVRGQGVLRWVLGLGAGLVAVLTVGNLLLGTTVKGIHRRLQEAVTSWAWSLESRRASGQLIQPQVGEDTSRAEPETSKSANSGQEDGP